LPTEIAVDPLRPETATGVVEHPHPVVAVVPLPSSPSDSSPQHSTLPPDRSTQADSPPAAIAITELDEAPLDEPDEPPLDDALPLDEPDEPPLDDALPLDEPDEPPLDDALPLDEPDEPPLDDALPLDDAPPLDVDEPKPDEPSSVTPPESAAALALPSSPGKSPMPRREPHALAPRHDVSAVSAASRL